MVTEIFEKPKPIIGTIELLPLPGSPGWNGHLEQVISRAEQEATALASGGVDGIVREARGSKRLLRQHDAHKVIEDVGGA
mgnify:CR=1 FL=1